MLVHCDFLHGVPLSPKGRLFIYFLKFIFDYILYIFSCYFTNSKYYLTVSFKFHFPFPQLPETAEWKEDFQ